MHDEHPEEQLRENPEAVFKPQDTEKVKGITQKRKSSLVLLIQGWCLGTRDYIFAKWKSLESEWKENNFIFMVLRGLYKQ